jgi:hypothetical protein
MVPQVPEILGTADCKIRLAGVNTNILSPPTFIDEPSGNGALNGIPVTVTASGTDRH